MIDGVVINKLTTHSDTRGFFREVVRFPEFKNIPVGQVSHSLVQEGVSKEGHGHVYQHQWNYVVSGRIKVTLIDTRVDSNTFKEVMEFVAGDENEPLAYYFPPGVLHGYTCIAGPLHIIYMTSGVYDPHDEIRMENKEWNVYIKGD